MLLESQSDNLSHEQTVLDLIPDAWGPKRSTDQGGVARTRTGPNDINLTPPSHVALVMLSPQPEREVALGGARRTIGFAPAGAVEIIPAGADIFARWRVTKENMLFSLSPSQLTGLAGAEFDKDDFQLRPPRLGLVDDRALLLARLAREEVERGEQACDICVDSLITLLATHLLRNYSSLGDHPKRRHLGGLSPRMWGVVSAYIEANLAEKLSIGDLARQVGLSPSHFLRAFRQTSGLPPHQYILGQRIASAERLIGTTDLPFAEVAAATGFSSNSHLTSTMRRVRGQTPKEMRRRAAGR